MPSRPAGAVLRDDNTFRNAITRRLAPWVQREIERLSDLLHGFSESVLAELGGTEKREILHEIALDAPFKMDSGRHFELTLPKLSVNAPDHIVSTEDHSPELTVKHEYSQHRYMAHLSLKTLAERASAIFRNIYVINDRGQLSVDVNDPRSLYWRDLLFEVMREYETRGISISEFGPHLDCINELKQGFDEPFRRAGQSVKRFTSPSDGYIVKYGLYEHIRDLRKLGLIRLGPATSYSDPSLVAARRDQEINRRVDWDSTVIPYGPPGTTPSYKKLPPGSRIETSLSIRTNYYIFCVSEVLKARLFNDFRANAALVIRDPQEFESRLQKEILRLYPGWKFLADRVEYFDPLNVSPFDIRFPFWKDFAYAYQEEVRFALFPQRIAKKLPPTFLEVGCLQDISDLILLD